MRMTVFGNLLWVMLFFSQHDVGGLQLDVLRSACGLYG